MKLSDPNMFLTLEDFNFSEKLSGSWATKHFTKSMRRQVYIEVDVVFGMFWADVTYTAFFLVLLVSRAGW